MLITFWVAALASAGLVALLSPWLKRQQMLDRPGARRLHQQPTARGGGLAIVVVVAFYLGEQMIFDSARWDIVLFAGGLLAVAIVGWCDDRSSLGIWPRLLVHALAGVAVALLVLDHNGSGLALHLAIWPLLTLIVFSVVAGINLHNFMDGANGMLAAQAGFVFAMLSVWPSADPTLAMLGLVALAAVLGFLPFNFPQARVFLGDVGSGALGYLIIALCWWALAKARVSVAEVLLLNSLFLIDSGCTLGWRLRHRKRWWRAHREHLYQWLVRSGASHAGVVIAYQLFNLLLVLPLLWSLRQDQTAAAADWTLASIRLGNWHSIAALIGVLALGIGGWLALKRACLARLRAQ